MKATLLVKVLYLIYENKNFIMQTANLFNKH